MASPAPSNAATSTLNPSLPSPRLPLELIDLIIDYCDEPFPWTGPLSHERLNTLALLCRVSKHFARRAQPLLFKRIVVEYPFNLNNILPTDKPLLDTLRTNAALQTAVQAFDVEFAFVPMIAERKRKQYVKTMRARWLMALRALPNVHTVSFEGGEGTGDRTELAMWKCVPPTARTLNLTKFDLKPKEVYAGYRTVEPRARSNPLLVVVDQHLATFQQLFSASDVKHIAFVASSDPRSPYMQAAK